MKQVFSLGLLMACQLERYCPEGLVPIPKGEPQYCIMRYEASVQNEKAYSQMGSVPTSLFSYSDAIEICKETPVRTKSGVKVGTMHLATLQEWRDAGDGIIGEGGTKYPWGKSPDVFRCVLQGPAGLKKQQPAGSKPSCCSVFDVCDQLGNLWEWVDSGLHIDISKWLAARKAEGYPLSLVDNKIVFTQGNWKNYILQSSDFQGGELVADVNGFLSVRLSKTIDRPVGGYLRPKNVLMVNERHLLPVSLDFSNQQTESVVRVNEERDLESISIKSGGSFYSGADADLRSVFFGHSPDFNGSIGFRCSSPVIEESFF